MAFKDIPIRQKLITVIMMTSGLVLFLTCTAFFIYEFYSFRQATVRHLSTLGQIIATNSTAALAFGSQEDANEILNALQAERHIVEASLYDNQGNLFSQYPVNLPATAFPSIPTREEGYDFKGSFLEGYQPVVQGSRRLGTLYLKSDLKAMNERFQLYGMIAMLVIAISFLLSYLLSRILQKGISTPILALAETAKVISNQQDYSVRAMKLGKDELGSLTDAFNLMLARIEEQNLALSQFNQKLEQKVSERTMELEAVNKELESFSYSISHDLRAPLRSIHGYTNILAEEYINKLDSEAKKLMNIILSNTKKMSQLIDDLLEFSKLGRQGLRKANVSMKNIVSDVWKELNLMKDRQVELVLKELPPAYADSITIRQVWVNLISNALKYSRNNEKTVVEISWQEKDGAIIYFIKDNGTGFDMKYYDKLFGVFQRLHSQKEFEGTGVGLAIVHRIILKHGGRIWAEGQVGQGASFYFTLPDF
jgi:signal transduction histidine kinase